MLNATRIFQRWENVKAFNRNYSHLFIQGKETKGKENERERERENIFELFNIFNSWSIFRYE